MRANKFVKKCGPYKVSSISQDSGGVRLEVYPAFPAYNLSEQERAEKDIDPSWAKDPRWAIHRLNGEGGGPGIFTCIALAEEFEKFLNQAYSPDSVAEWKSTLSKAMEKINKAAKKSFERAMAKQVKRYDY